MKRNVFKKNWFEGIFTHGCHGRTRVIAQWPLETNSCSYHINIIDFNAVVNKDEDQERDSGKVREEVKEGAKDKRG